MFENLKNIQLGILQLLGLVLPFIGFYFHFLKAKNELDKDYNLILQKIIDRKATKYRELFLKTRMYNPITQENIPKPLFIDFLNEIDEVSRYESDLVKFKTKHNFFKKLYGYSIIASVLLILICSCTTQKWLNMIVAIAIILYFVIIYILADRYFEKLRKVGEQPLIRSEVVD